MKLNRSTIECWRDCLSNRPYLLFFSVSLLIKTCDKQIEGNLEKLNKRLFSDDDEDCQECEEILESLEQIDGEVDQFGIDFVKIVSTEAAEKYNVVNIPTLMYFRKQVPMLYDGDLHQVDRILQWLTSQDVFEIKNEIEEVNRKMLDKLLEENEFLAVYFCEYS